MKIGVLQLNLVVGDLDGNAARIVSAAREAAERGASWCMTSELALTGYPPRDLLLYRSVLCRTQETVLRIARELENDIPILLGAVEANVAGEGKAAYNSAFWCMDGEIVRSFRKSLLPTYDVFDEDRYFESAVDVTTGRRPRNILNYMGHRIGVTICEDAWNDKDFWPIRTYHVDPVEELCREGVDVLVNLSASPFSIGKQQVRERMLGNVAQRNRIPLVYSNQTGGNDDLVFDGRSFAISSDGRVMARAKGFGEEVLVVDLKEGGPVAEDDFNQDAETYEALVLGLADYMGKTGFSRAVVGLSGGIDSAVTAAVAARALGPENVLGVLMPSPWSSEGSVKDSLELAKNIGIETMTLPIEPVMQAMNGALAEAFHGLEPDVTEENLQSRIRGNLLMALANKRRALVLTTGNKSELAVGYCTIYGDMAGGFAVISDLPKGAVYSLARWMNGRFGTQVPEATITKAPSAELRPGQLDQDSLPPYDVLDAILELHIEKHKGREGIIEEGFDPQVVDRVLKLVRGAEFKRRQAVPGVKLRARSFGSGWRMPLACKVEL
ncbi:MAG: NAD+ synthase [Desulfovibrionaceae bacterium]